MSSAEAASLLTPFESDADEAEGADAGGAYVLRSARSAGAGSGAGGAPQGGAVIDLQLLHDVSRAESDERSGAGFHDWTDDCRWASVGHARALEPARRAGGVRGLARRAWRDAAPAAAAAVIGAVVGTVGAAVNVSTIWAHHFTRGACVGAWWLPKLYCDQGDGTGHFREWSEILGLGADQWAIDVQAVVHICICCAMTLTACWLTKNIAPQAAGAGAPEIKAVLNGSRLRHIGSFRTLLVKWAGLILAIGGHLSVGKAAPMVHIGFCVATVVAARVEEARGSVVLRQELMTAGTAAGITVAFGAPIGGVLFAVEETASYVGPRVLYRCFVCSAAAAVTLQWWDPYHTGRLTLFGVNYHTQWRWWEIPVFCVVGAVGGAAGAAWNYALLAVMRLRKTLKDGGRYRPMLEVLLVTLLTCWVNLVVLPDGTHAHTDSEYLTYLFRRCEDPARCPMTTAVSAPLVLIKFALTAVSFGMLLPAGLLMPNFVLGAALGWTAGAGVDAFVAARQGSWPLAAAACGAPGGAGCVTPAVYALVGAAAVVCGVTRLTVALVTIVLELTGGIEYIVPVTLGVLAARGAAELVGGRDAVYQQIIDLKGLEFLDPKGEAAHPPDGAAPLRALLPAAAAGGGVTVLYAEQPLRDVVAALRRRGGLADAGFPVLRRRGDPRVVGFAPRGRLAAGLRDLRRRLIDRGEGVDAGAPCLLSDPAALRPAWDASGAERAYVLHGYVDPSPVTVTPRMDVARVLHIFRRLGLSAVVVVDDENRLVSALTKSALVRHARASGAAERAPLAALLRAAEVSCGCPGAAPPDKEPAPGAPDPARAPRDALPPLADVARGPRAR